MQKYIIVQDSRLNAGKHLALVDRNINQTRWWTSILENAVVFYDKQKANQACSKLKYNNPRVIPIEQANDVVKPIITVTYHTFERKRKTKNIFQMNDYEYKEWLGYSDANEYGGGMFE